MYYAAIRIPDDDDDGDEMDDDDDDIVFIALYTTIRYANNPLLYSFYKIFSLLYICFEYNIRVGKLTQYIDGG